MPEIKYKRILLKVSGEALGDHGKLFDFEQIDRVAGIIGQLHETGTEIAIVIGAGNIWRGRQGPSANMDAVIADQMGMLGTVINCLCMSDALRQAGVDHIEISEDCTMCMHHRYWSHRYTRGLRGSQGAVICCERGIL